MPFPLFQDSKLYIVLGTKTTYTYQHPFVQLIVAGAFRNREFAIVFAKEHIYHQYFAEELKGMKPQERHMSMMARSVKWGIPLPPDTQTCGIEETGGLCKVEAVIGKGKKRVDWKVEVVEKVLETP